MRRARVAAVVLWCVATGCAPDADTVKLGDWCPTAGGPSVPECTRLHPADPALRLPPNSAVGAVTRGGTAFVTAEQTYPIEPSLSERGYFGRGRDGYANALYRATIKDGAVVDVERVATVTEDALLSRVFAGAVMEGTIGRLVAVDSYSFDQTLPVRIEFDTAATGGKLTGRIVNAAAAVRSADGPCLRALSESDANPLTGQYGAAVWITREPAMHAVFDDELVLHWNDSVSNMGSGFFPSVATLAGKDPLASTWEAALHGNPVYGPPLTLKLVAGGGEPC